MTGSVVAVIPARMGSSRFPGKPLASLLGRPMIEHVYRRVAASAIVDDVVVATCDEEIVRAVAAFGGRAFLTASTHVRASDRVAEAAAGATAEIVVMVQGDEPMIRPEMVTSAVERLVEEPDLGCVNLVARICTVEEARDPNTIKVVVARNGDALFFSRTAIPTLRTGPFFPGGWLKQVCVIPFRRTALERFAALPPTPLEAVESIDMLRFLEHGFRVHTVLTDTDTHAVDTPSDLELVASRLRNDPFTATYLQG